MGTGTDSITDIQDNSIGANSNDHLQIILPSPVQKQLDTDCLDASLNEYFTVGKVNTKGVTLSTDKLTKSGIYPR